MKHLFKKKNKITSFHATLGFAFCYTGFKIFLMCGDPASCVLFRQKGAAEKPLEKVKCAGLFRSNGSD